jgi:hypothetical protein
MSAMAEGEDYASAGRASGSEKLAEWEIKARGCGVRINALTLSSIVLGAATCASRE